MRSLPCSPTIIDPPFQSVVPCARPRTPPIAPVTACRALPGRPIIPPTAWTTFQTSLTMALNPHQKKCQTELNPLLRMLNALLNGDSIAFPMLLATLPSLWMAQPNSFQMAPQCLTISTTARTNGPPRIPSTSGQFFLSQPKAVLAACSIQWRASTATLLTSFQ